MKAYLHAAAAALLIAPVSMAEAKAQDSTCGEISIAQMGWTSAEVITEVAKFLLEQGYGCKVTLVASDTIAAITSVTENGRPEIVTDLWLNSAGDPYRKLEESGRMVRLASVLDPGGVEGLWIPTSLAEANPELTTIDGILKNPELVGGVFNTCPDGWGCRVVLDNLVKALDFEGHGLKIFSHGSGETLASSIGTAVESSQPWFGYYWTPTVVMGKYPMTRVSLGEHDEAAFADLQEPGTVNPQSSEFPVAPVLTSVTAEFTKSHPAETEFLRHMSFPTDAMSELLAWKEQQGASAQETAVHFLTSRPDQWSSWLNDDARQKLSALIAN
ncbi:glycine betaine ABC transporter substrate-binding protein [Paracoccus sp. TOH]|uniref:glycine betaine ABC transporter substrate-binding protein n=1 Tax=Paracoccus sp. TOH TaxID=1263728 RepID=UPI0025B1B319|nr:glycine betaine ABC transporter substrate-binding protein [Paracoccus sp. TOH]WJS84391.1 glycine/betaine ABC transporter substrate-binding protein [Paracoccus sp. TOH]